MISEKSRNEMASGAGTKDDFGKPRLSLVPATALVKIAEVFTFGACKYSDNNWRNGMSWRRMYDALQRHLNAWADGEDTDKESRLSHLAHAGCCLMMLLTYTLLPDRYEKHDDRWKAEPKD